VHENCIAIDTTKACAHRIRTLGTPGDQLTDLEAAERSRGNILLPLLDHDANASHRRMSDQRLHRPAKDGLPGNQPELLGNIASETFPLPGGNNERCRSHGARL
jgi:hypothetical protein